MILDSSSSRQFMEIDEIGVLNKFKEIGIKTPLYRINNNHDYDSRLIQLLEYGTVADQELRPSLVEIISVLGELSKEEIPVFTIKEGNQKMLGIPNENSTGFSITINGKSYSLRK